MTGYIQGHQHLLHRRGRGVGMVLFVTPHSLRHTPTNILSPEIDPTEDQMLMDDYAISYNTIPGIGDAPYDLGWTLTHELGHWLNLFHPFQGSCSSTGDFVDDTPAMAYASFVLYRVRCAESLY